MVNCYVLAKVRPGWDLKVIREIKKIKQVLEVSSVYGEYDLVIKIKVEDFDELDDLIFNVLRKIGGIVATTTLIESKIP